MGTLCRGQITMAITQWHGPSSPATRYRPDLLATGHVRQIMTQSRLRPAGAVVARANSLSKNAGELGSGVHRCDQAGSEVHQGA
jgi:hypothetical protein